MTAPKAGDDPTREDYEKAAQEISIRVNHPAKPLDYNVPVRCLRHYEALLTAAADRMTWRPIETAPKDRTVVLISNPDWPPEGANDLPAVVSAYNENGTWRYMDGRRISDPAPTHWLPLPPAPKTEEAE